MKPGISKTLLQFLIIFVIIWAALSIYTKQKDVSISYNEFKTLLKADKIATVTIGDHEITATLKPKENLTGLLPKEKINALMQLAADQKQVATMEVNDPALISDLEKSNVQIVGQKSNKWFSLAQSWALPGLVFLLFLLFLFSRMGSLGNVMEIRKSKAKVYMEKQTGVTFKDVAGVDEAKNELVEVVEFLKNPKRYRRLGARMPKGVLLIGPPGTGKTLLARAVAGEAKVPFLSINGSEFVEMFVGVGAARVRDLFQEARTMAPSIIFIDELDALGRQRNIAFHGNDETEHTLNQLLSEMDGFDPNANVIILAATNRPEMLDPALLRAGRFDRQVLVDRPDKVGRLQILSIYLKKIQCAKDVDPETIVSLTPGFTGADLAALVNEAALLATRRDAKEVTMDDFTNAVERTIAGLEKKHRLLNANERRIVAYHEMGHALVAMVLPSADAVHKVSIIQRGVGALGYTMQRPIDDRYLITQEELKTRMSVMLGGQAAELAVFGQLSTGAADDLTKVTHIARDMVMRFGMSDELGHVVYEPIRPAFLPTFPTQHDFSEKTAQEIDKVLRELVQAAFNQALDIIKKNRDCLEEGAELLLKKETLDQNDLAKLHPKSRSR